MIESRVKDLIEASMELAPTEQLELISALTNSLYRFHSYEAATNALREPNGIYSLNRTGPVTDLSILAADFWPEDETADDMNNYFYQQRETDRSSDL